MASIIKRTTDSYSEYLNQSDNYDIYVLGYGQAFHDIRKKYREDKESSIAYFSMHYVLKGEGSLKLNGKKYALKKGDLFIIPPGVRFLKNSSLVNGWEIVWINFGGLRAAKYMETIGVNVNNPILQIKSAKTEEAICLIVKETALYQKAKETFSLSCFYNILTLLIEDFSSDQEFSGSDKKGYLFSTMQYIQLHYSDPSLSTQVISGILNLNPSYFSRYFSENMKMGFRNYLNLFRIKKACELLDENSDYQISEVAAMTGFLDPLYFSRIFKKYMYLSPTEYVRNLKKNSNLNDEKGV